MDFAKLAKVLIVAAESPAGQKIVDTALNVLLANQDMLNKFVELGLKKLLAKLEAS